jgi:ABC-type multidrug transport system ATPase subunit
LLWPDLTIEEHLYFYARLKGIAIIHEKKTVDRAMEEVHLINFAGYKVSELSGGMKR